MHDQKTSFETTLPPPKAPCAYDSVDALGPLKRLKRPYDALICKAEDKAQVEEALLTRL